MFISIDKEFVGIETYPLSNKSFQQNSGSAESEYLIRVVSDIESFVEKVQIVSAGYDDRGIWLMKFTNSPLEEGDIQFNYEHMVFTRGGYESYQFMFIDNQTAIASLDFSKEQYEYYLADNELDLMFLEI